MKHPIFNDQQEVDMMNLYEEGVSPGMEQKLIDIFISQGQSEREYKAYKQRIFFKMVVADEGCNLIQLKAANEWDEVLSVKTIEKMQGSDLKLPFKAYTIDLTNSEWTKYEYVHIGMLNQEKLFIFELNDGGGKRTHVMYIDEDKNIKDEVEKIIGTEVAKSFMSTGLFDAQTPTILMKEAIYKVISISMYMSMFKRDKERCVEVKSVNKKSKRKGIPGHTTNTIYLSQPKYKLDGAAGGGGKPTGLFVVKGHWRSQPIGPREEKQVKQIFIDSFFKGSGSKQLLKTYKV